jgi:hypothetical protein
VEGARCDEQDVVGLDRPCLVVTVVPSISGSRSRCTPSRLTSAPRALLAGADLVDLVEKDDAVLLHRRSRSARDCSSSSSLSPLRRSAVVAFGDLHLARLGPIAERLAEDVAEIDHAHLGARHAGKVEGGQRPVPVSATSISISRSSSSPFAQLLAELLARILAGVSPTSASSTRPRRRHRPWPSPPRAALARHGDGAFDQVADDLFDVAPDIADLGELGGLDLDERRLGERASRRAISVLPTPVGPIIRMFFRQTSSRRFFQLLAPPAVAQRDGDGALGVLLADDEAVEFGDDFAGAEIGQ